MRGRPRRVQRREAWRASDAVGPAGSFSISPIGTPVRPSNTSPNVPCWPWDVATISQINPSGSRGCLRRLEARSSSTTARRRRPRTSRPPPGPTLGNPRIPWTTVAPMSSLIFLEPEDPDDEQCRRGLEPFRNYLQVLAELHLDRRLRGKPTLRTSSSRRCSAPFRCSERSGPANRSRCRPGSEDPGQHAGRRGETL